MEKVPEESNDTGILVASQDDEGPHGHRFKMTTEDVFTWHISAQLGLSFSSVS